MYQGKVERQGRGVESVGASETLATQCIQVLSYLQEEADRSQYVGASLETLMEKIRSVIRDFSIEPTHMYPVVDILGLARIDPTLGREVIIETPDRSKPWHVGARRGKRGIEILIHR